VEIWEGEHAPIVGADRLLDDLERLIAELTRHREALKRLAGGNGYAPRL
jgi:hypothetical protein